MNYGQLLKKPHLRSVEELGMRTENSKTFDNLDGTKTWSGKIGAVHYKEDYKRDKDWKEIDTTPIDKGNYLLVDKAPIIVKIYKDKIGYEVTSRRSGHKFIVELDSKKPSKDDIEFEVKVESNRVRLWKTVKTDKVKKLKWKITEEGKQEGLFSLKFRDKPEAFDSTEIETKGLRTGLPKSISIITQKIVIDSNSFYWEETIPKENIKIDTDVEEDVSAQSDDAWDVGGGSYSDSQTYLIVGGTTGTDYSVGVRFQTVNVPNGATITNATLTFVAEYNDATDTGFDWRIYGNDIDDSTTFSDTVGNRPSQKEKTTNFVDWTCADGWDAGASRTTDNLGNGVNSPVGEVLGRVGWIANNDLSLIITPAIDQNGDYFYPASFNSTTYAAPHLLITYEAEATTTSTSTSTTSTSTSYFDFNLDYFNFDEHIYVD